MAKNNNLTDFLTDVADAIRAKKGTTGKINPQDFSAEIASIETGGGGGGDTPTPGMPVIGDGKTYLYIKIAEKGRMTVPLYFSQSVANGVVVDWGDGSASQTFSGTGDQNISHTYAEVGEYTISLNPLSGTLGLGSNTSSYCVMGNTSFSSNTAYRNMLKAVEVGKNVTSISKYAFRYCCSLASIVISEGVTSIGSNAFNNCYSLASIVIPESVTSIGNDAFNVCYSLASIVIPKGVKSIGSNAFYSCYSLASIVIPESVTSIGTYALYGCSALTNVVIPGSIKSIANGVFQGCYGVAYYDFTRYTSIPSLGGTSVFSNIPADCKIIVPDGLYDSWKSASNWSAVASYIVKASEYPLN